MREHLAIAELGLVEYQRAHALQQGLVAARMRDEIGDTLLLLEHPHVYTLGRGADEKFILATRPNIPITRVSRGGEVTYHGPGQLVAYPIVKLKGSSRDVGRYLRALEQAMIDALAKYDISAARRERLTGVWVDHRKIASIGVGIRRWVTYHGLALNVRTELSYFDSIVPCGIDGCEMTSIERLGHGDVTVKAFGATLAESFGKVLEYRDLAEIGAEPLWSLIDASSAIAEASN